MRLRSHDLPSVAPRKASATVRCPSCGSPNDEGANFCTQCGTALGATDVTAVLDRDAVRSRVAAGRGVAAERDATRAGGAGAARAAAPAEESPGGEEDDPTDPGHDEDGAGGHPGHAGDLRRCPRCRAANSPRRVLCGRCGADLDTGEPARRRPREGFAAASSADRPDRRGIGGMVLAIVTAGVLIGGGLGAMVALGVGPFADAGGPPPAVFDDDRYVGAPQDLPAPAVGASTTHEPVADRSFDAQLMLDGDVTTAWNNSGRDAPMGIGEELRVEFDEPVWLTGIVLANGDQRDDDRYLGNARVQRARVVLDAGVSFTVAFLDQQGRQAVRLDVPELTTGLRIEILEAYPGDTYEDLAISELGFRGYRADADDAELARRRAQFPRVVPTEG